jgi:dipeptidyl aminopeptidase/acylaminoacyl peptidase
MHRNPSHRAILSSLSLLCLCAPLVAQLYKEETGPGLDPTPIVIPPFEKKTARPITTRDLLSIRDLYGVSISPAGDRVAFILGQAVAETNRYRSALYVVSTKPGSVPVSLGTAGRPFWKLNGQWFPEPPSWSPDGKWIAARMDGGTGWQVWRWSPEGGASAQVTHSKLDVQTFRWSKDGSKVVFEVYRPRDEEGVRRMEEGGILFDRDFEAPWDIHKGVIEQKLGLQDAPSQTWLHDVATGEAHAATKEEVERESIWVRSRDEDNMVEAEWSPDHSRLARRAAIRFSSGTARGKTRSS